MPYSEWLVVIAEKSVQKTLLNILWIQIEYMDVDTLEDFLQQYLNGSKSHRNPTL